ncbi:MAG: hypothetical protein K6F39_00575 [Lachnospiraceae bacterium]|nr:hypothetical protein [Lachnospiraceae bacterium]
MPEYIPGTHNGFSTAALVFGIVSVLTLISLRLPLSMTTGALAILFACLSHGKNEKSATSATIGLISGSIGVASNTIFAIVITFLFLFNAEFRTNVFEPYVREFEHQYQQMLENYYGDEGNEEFNNYYGSSAIDNSNTKIFY